MERMPSTSRSSIRSRIRSYPVNCSRTAADIGVSVITTKHAYEELEREGLIRSVSNKGFYVCKYNTDYLHEKQLMELEKRLQEWITLAKQAGLGTEDIREMLEGLL